ncbi:fasciclin domain-containing protein [Blastococcus sp. KM273128]|uniref:fasciclin domain-containing protein n=1 Tax=Blastococcus sp. KM273128 TaxID=2570314 RepID=UPI001F27653D|nr:fasciclin domain-containing protein [Blastococcus sp. KM273128]MCF6744391.1 fasciclin domain-containing protein [Blastococcus sp. KM273128]
MTRTPPRGIALAAVAGLAIALGGCGSDDAPGGSAAPTTPGTADAAPRTSSAAPAPEGPFGEGCAAVPPEGPGSVAGMGAVPVVTAAGSTPMLSRLVQAVQAADLVETLDTTQEITVLAPSDAAFEAVPADALQGLLGDTPALTALLTHHVLPGRLTPAELVGTHTTLNNDEVTIEGSGLELGIGAEGTVVGAEASVVCGNLQTANATVYVIDQVLQPAEG